MILEKYLTKRELKELNKERDELNEVLDKASKKFFKHRKALKKTKPYFETFSVKYDPSIYNFDQKFLENCRNKTFYKILEILEYDQKFQYPNEREFIKQIFYSLGISMENNLNVDFFKLKIKNMSIRQTNKYNKFSSKKTTSNYLEIITFYPVKIPRRKREIIW